MLLSEQVEELISVVATMDRPALVRQIKEYRARFPLDFTSEFLETVPLDRLRHIFLAVCLQSQQMPEMEEASCAHAA